MGLVTYTFLRLVQPRRKKVIDIHQATVGLGNDTVLRTVFKQFLVLCVVIRMELDLHRYQK
jgi:hypothetical protein